MNPFFTLIFCLVALWLVPVYLPWMHLFFFVPLLALFLYLGNLQRALIVAFGCGVFIDLLSGYHRIGIHAAAYVIGCLTTGWLSYFCFFTSKAAISVLAMMLSFFTTLFLCIIGFCMGEFWYPQWNWWLYDLGLGTLWDGLYTTLYLLLASLPDLFFKQLKQPRRKRS